MALKTPNLAGPQAPPGGIPALEPVRPGEPMIELRLNGVLLLFPLRHARVLLFHAIPAWMRDSLIDPPEMDPEAQKIGLDKGFLEFLRSGLKNLVRLKLVTLLKGVYGPEVERWPRDVHLPRGREDALPIIDQALVDAVISMAYYHPLDVDYDPLSGIVTGIRPGYRVAGAVDAGNAARAARPTGPGSESRGPH